MKCEDPKCGNHGSLRLRGRTFQGIVIDAKAQKTASVEWDRRYHVKKYERYEKRRTTVKAYNPGCIGARKGDIVQIIECRPLSKSKHFVITKKIGEDILFEEKEKMIEESKKKTKKEIGGQDESSKSKSN